MCVCYVFGVEKEGKKRGKRGGGCNPACPRAGGLGLGHATRSASTASSVGPERKGFVGQTAQEEF